MLLVALDFIGAAMLAVAGAAMGQSVNIAVNRKWTEAPLLFMILVGRPGRAKSPVIRLVVRPLAEIDRRLRQESLKAREAWEKAKKDYEKDPKNNPPPGPEPPQLRGLVKDITRESLCIILKDNPRGVLCDPDEADAWIASFNEYRGGKGRDRQFWLSIWSCTLVSVDRKGGRESIYVPFPLAAVLAGMPPGMLGGLSEERGREDGFLDRILPVFPEESAVPRQHWTEADLAEDTEKAWTDAISRLHDTPMAIDQASGEERPFFVTFTADGKRDWVAWFNAHADETSDPEFPDTQAGAWSKLRAHVARFALILSGLRWACSPASPRPGPVDSEDVQGAIKLANYFKSHLIRVRHEMTGGVASADAKAILDWIKRKRLASFREADVGANLRRYRESHRALSEALKALESAGAIRPRREAHTHGRHPTPTWEVHPELVRAPENPGNTGNGPSPAAPPTDSGISGNFRRVPESPKGDIRAVFVGVQPGDMIQWVSRGVEQFTSPQVVREVVNDPAREAYVFVEESETGIPAAEVIPWPCPTADPRPHGPIREVF
jgi:hypothetical protein